MLLIEFFENHYKPRRLFGKSADTVRLHRISISAFGKSLGKIPDVADLTHENLMRHMQRLIDDGLATATANKDRNQLQAQWRFAFRLKLLSEWPDVPELPEPERIPEAWMPDESHRLLDAARNIEGCFKPLPGECRGIPKAVFWEPLILLCLDTGERIGAIRPARWRWIRGEWIRIPGEVRKGKRRDMQYRISPNTLEKLKHLRNWSPRGDAVFPWPYCYNYFWKLYGEVLDAAGLPNTRHDKCHRLRRTTASVLESAGMDAQRALDHSSKKITRGYVDPRFVKKKQPCDVLADFLRNPPPPNPDRKTG